MRIYLMGICGTAMGNAAQLLRTAGDEVLGADAGIYPPMSTVLTEAGVVMHEGYSAERLASLRPDLVVIGNALSRGNPEVEWLLESREIPFTSLPALLHDRILARRRTLVISGTHGKTTTTAMAAYLLRANGADPGFLIGGVPQDPPTGNHLGSPADAFVIEGDEYDSAFFDKRSKFIHYAPRIAVLNNLEFDHADIFRDLADVRRSFEHFTRLVPRNGYLLVNSDDENLAGMGPFPWTTVVRFGTGPEADLRIADFSEGPQGASFELRWRGALWARVGWSLPGIYNARNAAAAALAAACELHPDDPTRLSLESLSAFRGVRRRQEIRFASDRLTVVEDFGHHPTALRQALDSFRLRFPGRRLVAAFEPRSNTARTRRLQAGFLEALAAADAVYLGPVSRGEKLDAGERFDAEGVAAALRQQGRTAGAFADNQALLRALEADLVNGPKAPSSLVVFFSNGSFDGIIGEFAGAAEQAMARR